MKETLVLLICLFSYNLNAQVEKSSDLYKDLKANDSLLFNIAYNQCDVAQLEALLSDQFEFYHDQSGITASKADFVTSIREGLCKLPYTARRELVEQSLEVYPLYNNGVLYGAIQMGVHKFYAVEGNKPAYFTSIAKFTHLWLLEEDHWKLSKGLSYDHQDKNR